MSRECRKCGDKIPWRITVEGKVARLQNRKFCLKCSPYGGRNTCPDIPNGDPNRILAVKKHWKDFTKDQKNIKICSSYYRGLKKRQELYDLLGGKCQVCGYKKCNRALSFHHKDPKDKKFDLTLNNLWSHNAEAIYEEANKCMLVCLNCHTEIEDTISKNSKNSTIKMVNEKYGTNF